MSEEHEFFFGQLELLLHSFNFLEQPRLEVLIRIHTRLGQIDCIDKALVDQVLLTLANWQEFFRENHSQKWLSCRREQV